MAPALALTVALTAGYSTAFFTAVRFALAGLAATLPNRHRTTHDRVVETAHH